MSNEDIIYNLEQIEIINERHFIDNNTDSDDNNELEVSIDDEIKEEQEQQEEEEKKEEQEQQEEEKKEEQENAIIPANDKKINDNTTHLIDFGFIISRHVNSEQTNKYWNQNVKLLRTFYPLKKIVIIDDNSDKRYLKSEHNYKNLTIIQSEFPGRGELLPYIYYAKNKWFERAVIIHDGVFFHRRIPFERIKKPFMPLWHFNKVHNKTHFENNIKVSNVLNKCKLITHYLTNETNKWTGVFGAQSLINYNFLIHITNKYNIDRLINVVKTRIDRCSLERIFGIILYLEFGNIKNSILGDIQKKGLFGYTFDQYKQDFKNRKMPDKVLKVFTGR